MKRGKSAKSSCLKFGENGHFLKMSQIGLKLAWDDCPIQPIMNQGGRVQNCNVQKFCVKMLYYLIFYHMIKRV